MSGDSGAQVDMEEFKQEMHTTEVDFNGSWLNGFGTVQVGNKIIY